MTTRKQQLENNLKIIYLGLQVDVIFNENSDSFFVTILTGSLKSRVPSKNTIDLKEGNKTDIIQEQHKDGTRVL